MVSEMESVNKTVNSTSNSNNTNVAAAAYNLASNNNNSAPAVQPVPIQSVGIEFVRQYYTLLNRAPNLLFRFYSDDSTFIHGCLDKPGEIIQHVKGQKQINAKIMSLNFENCHTKIRQVDSMETIGNGVVIQVIGELSNNGQPLRRFNQTFVLTPQSPNKYYVRNDIFRYQEEIENEVEEIENHSAVIEDSQVANSSNVKEKEFVTSFKANGNAEELANSVVPPEKVAQPQPSVQAELESIHQKVILQETKTLDELKPEQEDEPEVETNLTDEIPKSSVSPSANEPKTYAGILGRSSQGSNVVSTKTNFNPNNAAAAVVNESAPSGNFAGENPPIAGSNLAPTVFSTVPKPPFAAGSSVNPQQQPQRSDYRFQKKAFNRRNDSRDSGKNNDSDSGDGGEHYNHSNSNSSNKKYPDENQLFIGNLLPDFTEEDLEKLFGKYGKILDIRIHRQKTPNSKSRNYGFITYEEKKIVDYVISQKPIYHDNHRYNVEKKQGKSNFDRSRGDRNQNMNSSRNANMQSNNQNIQSGSQGGGPRHMQQVNVGSSSGNLPGNQPNNPAGGGSRGGNRMGSGGGGQNYNHSSSSNNNGPNNNNNPNNINRGQSFQNRNVFNQQQQQQNR